ncbi:MAG: hypothetical protein P8Z37_18190 [Acidobacteriota bacterium]|jgi:hypothetical protein
MMVRFIKIFFILTLLAIPTVLTWGQGEENKSVVPQTPEWEKLTSLVGEWEAVMQVEGKPMTSTLEIRMTGDNSAIMHWMDKDSPDEMITMIHPDGKRLLATHYCAAHNQPRMSMIPSKASNQIEFQFMDGTNIAPGDGYMTGIVFKFIDADHHEESWIHSSSPTPAVFKYTRKK